MTRIKKAISVLVFGFLCLLLLVGCNGTNSNGSEQSQKAAILALLNNARISNNVSVLVENDQADLVAARIANSGIDYMKGNINDEQLDYEFYNAAYTKIQGNYCTAIYTNNRIPTRTSDFSNEKVSHKNGSIVGIAIREYKNTVLLVVIVY